MTPGHRIRPFGFIPEAHLAVTSHDGLPANGPIDLIIAPVLVKHGNAAGESYDHATIIAPGEVFVEWHRVSVDELSTPDTIVSSPSPRLCSVSTH